MAEAPARSTSTVVDGVVSTFKPNVQFFRPADQSGQLVFTDTRLGSGNWWIASKRRQLMSVPISAGGPLAMLPRRRKNSMCGVDVIRPDREGFSPPADRARLGGNT